MKRRKILSLALIVALFAIVVSGTIAYFSDKTGDVKNEFKTANLQIELFEHDQIADEKNPGTWTASEELVAEEGEEAVGVTYENILPGMVLPKDPTVRVLADSADCWVFVKGATELDTAKALYLAVNGKELTDADTTAANAVAILKTLTDFDDTKWEIVDFKLDGTKVLFVVRYKQIVPSAATATELNLFTKISVDKEWEADTMNALNNATLTLQAFAIQSYGVDAETAYSELSILN